MTRKELISELMKYGNDDTRVAVFTRQHGDNVEAKPISCVHDGWYFNAAGDTIDIEVDTLVDYDPAVHDDPVKFEEFFKKLINENY